MRKTLYALLYLIALLLYAAVGFMQQTPGYMDASYYFTTGQQVAQNGQAVEPYLWNYLNDPQQIPSPAFTYWMPLPALLAALGMWILQSTTFTAARIPFLLLAALIPVLTVYLASRFTQNRFWWLIAALFSLFCGSYLPYLTITETFVPFFVLGAGYFVLADKLINKNVSVKMTWLLLGLLGVSAGLMHLTRADGILWLAGGALVIWLSGKGEKLSKKVFIKSVLQMLVVLVGYGLMMVPWFMRNYGLFGSIFAPASSLTIWFTNYNDLFMYPTSVLTPGHLFSVGMVEFLKVRGLAAVYNIETLIGAGGTIVLFPFMIVGMWNSRRNGLSIFALIMFSLLFSLMTLVFPFAGYRGGFLHSLTAFQIYLWAMAVYGLELTVAWTIKKLKWVENKSQRLLGSVLTAAVVVISGVVVLQKIGINASVTNTWDEKFNTFMLVDQQLHGLSRDANFSVMVNDSPSYFAATGQTTIQLISGAPEEISNLMEKFNIRFLLIDKNVPESLSPLYDNPGEQLGLSLIGESNGYYIYERE